MWPPFNEPSISHNVVPLQRYRCNIGHLQRYHIQIILVAKCLNGLIIRATEPSLFSGFKVSSSNLETTHLYYTDDTLILGDPSVENLRAIKATMRGFELALVLWVNFHKSSLIGINVDPFFLVLVDNFLDSTIESLPFKYLGMPVGANPWLESTWKPLFNLI